MVLDSARFTEFATSRRSLACICRYMGARRYAMHEDILQTALLEAWRGRDGFRGTTENEAWAWWYGVLRNVSLSWICNGAGRRIAREAELLDCMATANDWESGFLIHLQVSEILERLPAHKREILEHKLADERARHHGDICRTSRLVRALHSKYAY